MDNLHSSFIEGVVTFVTSENILVSDQLHRTYRLPVQKHACVPGDRIWMEASTLQTGRPVVEWLPRENTFSRRASSAHDRGRGQTEQVYAANIDWIIPVFAVAQPAPSWNMLDRYLVLAQANNIPAAICLTKLDLDHNHADIAERVEIYRRCGYRVFQTSQAKPDSLAELGEIMAHKTSLLLGKSGAGKTTLVNLICPDLDEKISSVSQGGLHRGRHTTSFTRLYPLRGGGFVVDTPGSRELGLWQVDAYDLAGCFPEMAPYIGACRFGLDCLHIEEPGCAIRKAVMNNEIHPRRYQSYIRMLEST